MNPSVEHDKPGYFNQFVRQQSIAEATEASLKKLSSSEQGDVQGIAASQIELLSKFYDLSLSQASRSFRWALVASMIGLIFLLAAIAFQQMTQNAELAKVALIGGALIEFIAAVNFYLYGRTLSQLTLFQERLENTQRFLLANSLCENLSGDLKDQTRAALILTLVGQAPVNPGREPRESRKNQPADTDPGEDNPHPAAANSQ